MMSKLRELPIVMVSMSRWDGDFSSASWSLAKTFAKTQPVIYVDYPYTLLDLWRERKKPSVKKRKKALLWGKYAVEPLKQFAPQLYALTPRAVLPINWIPEGKLYRLLSKINDRILVNAIKKALKELHSSDFIFFNSFNPLYLSNLPNSFRPARFIYQSRDNIRALEPYLQKHGANAELCAIQNADLSIATSKELQKDLTLLSGKKVEYLPNAADFDTFRRAYDQILPVPVELKGINKQIIGYTGNICHRTDYELLQKICLEHPDKAVVMVGPRNHWNSTTIDLDAIPNLHFVGPKPIEALPTYLAHFDVLILPFLRNEVTKSIYPLKINEYLASGKPIIATPFSEDMAEFSKVVRLESDHDKFVKAINEELDSDSLEKRASRHQTASHNTWEARVAQIWNYL